MRLLLAILACVSVSAQAATITVCWDRVADTNVVGYQVYWGQVSRAYGFRQITTNLCFTITNATNPTFIAVRSINYFGLESDYSKEVRWPEQCIVTAQVSTNGVNWVNFRHWTNDIIKPKEFWRLQITR